ncbi:hypothetical protein QN359_07340 [Undibacterium sp. 5I2]|nr:hypothetical protein [Undibacterium sp. 5I2]
MKLNLQKTQQGPVLAKGSDSNGQACSSGQIAAAGGCVGGSGTISPPSGTVTYTTSTNCC